MQHGTPVVAQSDELIFDFGAGIVVTVQELLAQRNAGGEVILSRFYLGFQTLVVVHQQFDSTHVSGFLTGVHLSNYIIHPLHQSAHLKRADNLETALYYLYTESIHPKHKQ